MSSPSSTATHGRLLLLSLLALLCAGAFPAAAQQNDAWHAIGFAGAGGRGDNGLDLEGPRLSVAVALERSLGDSYAAAVHSGLWATPLVCTPSDDGELDRVRCATSGSHSDLQAIAPPPCRRRF